MIQQASLLHIRDQSRGGLIHDLCLHRMCLEDIRMGIPVGNPITSRWITAIEKLNDSNTFLD